MDLKWILQKRRPLKAYWGMRNKVLQNANQNALMAFNLNCHAK